MGGACSIKLIITAIPVVLQESFTPFSTRCLMLKDQVRENSYRDPKPCFFA